MPKDPEETRKHYAQSQGLSEDDSRVKSYMGEMHRGRGYNQDEDDSGRMDFTREDPKFIEAIQNYAKSQGVDIDDPRVIKYARGLKSRTGDFGGREQDSPVGWRKKE